MSALSRFEELMQELIDRRVVRLLGGNLQPVDLAQRLARYMDESHLPGATMIPNHFIISLNPEDYARTCELDAAIERNLAQYAVEAARERGLNFTAPPHVRLQGDHRLEPGRLEVQAEVRQPLKWASPERDRSGSRRLQRPTLGQAPMAERLLAPTGASAAGQASERDNTAGRLTLAWLVLADGGAGQPLELAIRGLPFNIGRGEGNDLVLSDQRVSRDHAHIELRGSHFYLVDRGSKNGTAVNGRKVQKCRLRSGDHVSLAGVDLEFRAGSDR